jgi:Rrf2 family transcriptional regulator, iron-sulfur cluster assembly transcription factor
MARHSPPKAMLGRELALKADIPANYLAKILLTLKNVGILSTARGSRGGYWLARPAGEIRLIEIVKLFDQIQIPMSCLLGQEASCCEADPCTAHQKWHEIRKTYTEFLESTSVAQLATEDSAQGSTPKHIHKANA